MKRILKAAPYAVIVALTIAMLYKPTHEIAESQGPRAPNAIDRIIPAYEAVNDAPLQDRYAKLDADIKHNAIVAAEYEAKDEGVIGNVKSAFNYFAAGQ